MSDEKSWDTLNTAIVGSGLLMAPACPPLALAFFGVVGARKLVQCAPGWWRRAAEARREAKLAEERERNARLYAESQQAAAAAKARQEAEMSAKQQSDAVRRANARFEAETMFRRHYRALRDVFPQEAFDALMKHLGDDAPPEAVEERLRMFRELVIELVGGPGKGGKARDPEELTAWYEHEKSRLLGRQMDDNDRRLQLANLYRRYVDLMDEAMKELEP